MEPFGTKTGSKSENKRDLFSMEKKEAKKTARRRPKVRILGCLGADRRNAGAAGEDLGGGKIQTRTKILARTLGKRQEQGKN